MKRTLLAVFCLTATASGGDKLWTSDDIVAVRTVSDPQFSPDGRHVAYVVTELNEEGDDYQSDVWLVPTAGGEARALTSSPANDDSPRWSPDGKQIAFLSERPRPGYKKDDGDEGKRQVWATRPDGGEPRPLTASAGSVSRFEWSPDGRGIAYLAREAKSEERKKREKDKDDWWTPAQMYPWNRMWILDLATRQARQLTNEKHATGFSFSPDGQRLVVALQPTPFANDGFASDLYLVAAAGGAPKTLVARPGRNASPAWSPDGKWIAYVTQDGKDREWFTNTFIGLVAPEGGPPRNLTARFDERIASDLVWTPDSRALLFAAVQKTAQHLYRASTDGVVTPLTQGPEVNGEPAIDAAGTTLVFLREQGTQPREVWRMALPATGEGADRRQSGRPRSTRVQEGARHLEGRRRVGDGRPAGLPRRLRGREARPPSAQRARRARGHPHEYLHPRVPPLRLAPLRAEGLGRLPPEPARQRGPRREVPGRQRP